MISSGNPSKMQSRKAKGNFHSSKGRMNLKQNVRKLEEDLLSELSDADGSGDARQPRGKKQKTG